MSDFIGASLADLENVSANFINWTDVAQDSGKTVVATCNNAVNTLRTETQTAQTTCIDSIEGMKTDFSRERRNRERGRCRHGCSLRPGRGRHEHRLRPVPQPDRCARYDLEDIATSYDQYAVAAGESSHSMSEAIRVQRENLDAAMRGMTY